MNTFGWELPPGVTQREIDGADEDELTPEDIADARAERDFERRYQESER